MNSSILIGKVIHARKSPVQNCFDYPAYFYQIDLDELKPLDTSVAGFSHNKWAIASLHNKDYIDGSDESLRTKVLRVLEGKNYVGKISRIELITSCRYFGKVFNPVSFFICKDIEGKILAVIAQVNNTFNETHLYLLEDPKVDSVSGAIQFQTKKNFHVSPFFSLKGEYEFSFKFSKGKADIQVNYLENKEVVLEARLVGYSQELNSRSLRWTLFRYPINVFLTVPRILWQAARLHYLKKLPIYSKPVPFHENTRQYPPKGWIKKFCVQRVLEVFSKINQGALFVRMPDDSYRVFGDDSSGTQASMQIKDYDFFVKAALGGDIGFGEAFVLGMWESENPEFVLSLFIQNMETIDAHTKRWAFVNRIAQAFQHRSRKNNLKNSKENIGAHYDLSNDFFKLFLDETMLYSCAYFDSKSTSLHAAQKQKLTRLIQKAKISKEDHVLEIGCGWGGLALEAVRQTGCKVTGVTISEEQYALAKSRVKEAGLESQIDIQFCDYRKIQGTYDKIVSIEMLEAVGHEYLGEFFQTCDRLLKPKGLVALQMISIPDQRYEEYRRNCDWIQKYIFPGGHLPSLTAVSNAMTENSQFVVENLENIGPHYAETLRRWRINLINHSDKLASMGYNEKFMRTWIYYFTYCEAAFESRFLNTLHLVLTRPLNKQLSSVEENHDQPLLK